MLLFDLCVFCVFHCPLFFERCFTVVQTFSSSAAPEKPLGFLPALPLLNLLQVGDRDLAEIRAFRKAAAAQAPVLAINWCGLEAKATALIASLAAAGVPVPSYLALVVQVLAAFCPASNPEGGETDPAGSALL